MKMSFSTENLAPERENFPKLKLGAQESARIYAFESPVAAYVHNLRKPKIINGRVQTIKDQKGNTGWDYDFVSNPLCIGDPDTIRQEGSDAKNCPACKAVKDHGWDMFKPPVRKFAMHVYQYTTNGNASIPRTMNGDTKVWVFSDKKFGELVAINDSFASLGGLAGVDLQLGPCVSAVFQQFNILPSPEVAWNKLANGKERLEEAKLNQAKDLYFYIGRKMSKDAMEDKVAEIVTAHRQANGLSGESASDDLAGAENLDAGLANLLSDDSPKPAASNTSNKSDSDELEGGDFEDILKSLG
jgi:hypothetical protein